MSRIPGYEQTFLFRPNFIFYRKVFLLICSTRGLRKATRLHRRGWGESCFLVNRPTTELDTAFFLSFFTSCFSSLVLYSSRKQKILSLSLQPLFHFRFYWIARSLYYKELWHYKFILCWIPLYFANAFEKIISVKCSEFQSLLYKAENEKLKCSTVSFYKDIFLPIFHMTLHKKSRFYLKL